MNKHSWKGASLLLIAAFIWGTAFVAQSVGSNDLNALAFNCIRNFIGVLALIPVLLWQIFTTKADVNSVQTPVSSDNSLHTRLKSIFTRDLFLGGLICGTALCIASNFQQMGIEQSTVGKSAFITALYIVLVPISGLFFKKKVSLRVWFCVILSVIGLYLLCLKDEAFVLTTGDIYLLLCAFFFTIQITAVDYFAQKVNCVALSMMQFLVTAILSGIGMLVTEIPSWTQIMSAMIPLLYAGVMSSGIAYTFQIIGQKHLSATVATLIMSLESVFATLAGWIILKEILSTKELIGCGLVFTAVIWSQLPNPKKKGCRNI
ncbi:MAG: DMT family transporter [Agathobacter sp.]|nr:DMT family transporter [Agathobacter sp.]